MYFCGLFKKRISIKQGERLLSEYCKVNGFDDDSKHWKKSTHSTNWFAYRKRSNNMIANNWVSYHPTKGNYKYSIWIDLVTKEIIEILRKPV